ncbi:TetR family transcriptional regulator [Novosphingobium sp. 1949]|uniref:TetR family transcriptional regulator n=1 Tax=Novosphingobium organovorum TaxID=2930092 RepID=A0ABT0BBW9_9SPHN|nr:TetR/AcrR family transcriptional regulator [Novosphingobium organovorum]MCJ2182547.1 TetR family transcriptional regulator [Novosphingobium organovorum]
MTTRERPARPRNAQATKDAIAKAARRLFVQQGYDRTGLREIAGAADVDPAMIARYFGSKRALFAQTVLPLLDAEILLTPDAGHWPQQVARLAVDPAPVHKRDIDPTGALLLSIASREVAPMIVEALGHNAVAPLARHLRAHAGPPAADADGREDGTLNAAFALAMLLGFDALYRIAPLDALRKADPDQLRDKLAAVLDAIVSPPAR